MLRLLFVSLIGIFFIACQQKNNSQIDTYSSDTKNVVVNTEEQKKIPSDSLPVKDQAESEMNRDEQNVITQPIIQKTESQPKSKPAPTKTKIKKVAKIQFEQDTFDFGQIEEGDIIKHKFVFENKGNKPLQISKVIPSCGCTVPSFPFIDIDPTGKGYIGVTYNSVGKMGSQVADIMVHSNASQSPFKIFLIGEVFPKDLEETDSIQ